MVSTAKFRPCNKCVEIIAPLIRLIVACVDVDFLPGSKEEKMASNQRVTSHLNTSI